MILELASATFFFSIANRASGFKPSFLQRAGFGPETERMSSMKQKSNKLQARDLVTAGIFTALYMVVCVIFEVLGGLGPLV